LQCTFTYNLCSAYDRVCGISRSDPGGPWLVSRHLDEAGEDGCPDAIELAALGAATAFCEFYLVWVERASKLGNERAVERVCGWSRRGRRTVQHARELVGVFEDRARPECIVRPVLEQRGERW
jgi:hypothetical protein